MAVTIRDCQPSDAAAIASIYNHFILNTCVSFEEPALPAAGIAQRVGYWQLNMG